MPDVNQVNKWWGKEMAKEQLRDSPHPQAPKGHRWEVKTRDASRTPTDGRTRERVIP